MMGMTGCIGSTGRIGGWTDPSIYSLSDWVDLRVFWMSFWHPWGSFCNRFWSYFGGPGSVLDILHSPGAGKGGRVEKVAEKVVQGSFVGPAPGPPLESKSIENEKKPFRGARWKTLCAKRCARGVSGSPPTMKIMVSLTRNRYSHISTWSSKTIENGFQWVPFGIPFGGFGGCWGPF